MTTFNDIGVARVTLLFLLLLLTLINLGWSSLKVTKNWSWRPSHQIFAHFFTLMAAKELDSFHRKIIWSKYESRDGTVTWLGHTYPSASGNSFYSFKYLSSVQRVKRPWNFFFYPIKYCQVYQSSKTLPSCLEAKRIFIRREIWQISGFEA